LNFSQTRKTKKRFWRILWVVAVIIGILVFYGMSLITEIRFAILISIIMVLVIIVPTYFSMRVSKKQILKLYELGKAEGKKDASEEN